MQCTGTIHQLIIKVEFMSELPAKISIGHGSGGKMTRSLIEQLFVREFASVPADRLSDSYLADIEGLKLAFTSDSYVVSPLFFPGGDIGKLSVCGTVNDLAVSGAVPLCLSASFIIEEGFETELLKRIVKSMAAEALKAGVKIVTGDTKVVNRGKCDKLFISTSGIGIIQAGNEHISGAGQIEEGDKIIFSGTPGDHSIAILAARSEFDMQTDIISDCASLNRMLGTLVKKGGIRFMRDATRGGLATVLVELARMTGKGIAVEECRIPVNSAVESICEVLGFDPLYLANEGKVLMVVAADMADSIVESMRSFPEGRESAVIGTIDSDVTGVRLQTLIGGSRTIDMLASDQLPRIC